ncbi:hypothetical protein GCM10009415_53960 [Chitinophaga japonensis]
MFWGKRVIRGGNSTARSADELGQEGPVKYYKIIYISPSMQIKDVPAAVFPVPGAQCKNIIVIDPAFTHQAVPVYTGWRRRTVEKALVAGGKLFPEKIFFIDQF